MARPANLLYGRANAWPMPMVQYLLMVGAGGGAACLCIPVWVPPVSMGVQGMVAPMSMVQYLLMVGAGGVWVRRACVLRLGAT